MAYIENENICMDHWSMQMRLLLAGEGKKACQVIPSPLDTLRVEGMDILAITKGAIHSINQVQRHRN